MAKPQYMLIQCYNKEDIEKVKKLMKDFFKHYFKIEEEFQCKENDYWYILIMSFHPLFAMSKRLDKYCCGIKNIVFDDIAESVADKRRPSCKKCVFGLYGGTVCDYTNKNEGGSACFRNNYSKFKLKGEQIDYL